MQNVHHRPIKRFSLDGTIYDDSAIWRLKQEYLYLIDFQMRSAGYVPRLDIDIDFTIEYNERAQIYNFELSVYGVYVGKRKSEWILGVDERAVIPIQQSRSKEYSSKAA